MQAIWPLGNDIVDLRLPDNKNSAANPRFVQRVLATEERPVTTSTNDDRLIWAYWAAKETAYKSLKKTTPELKFSHRQFVVHPETADRFGTGRGEAEGDVAHQRFIVDSATNDGSVADRGTAQGNVVHLRLTDLETANVFVAVQGTAQGNVLHQQSCVPVSWAWTSDWVHCVSNYGESSQYRIEDLSQWTQSDAFSELKNASQLSDASVAVRLLALSLLEEAGFDNIQIKREPTGRRPGPPQVVRDGIVLSNIDLSLSHDGRYVAAAIQIRK